MSTHIQNTPDARSAKFNDPMLDMPAQGGGSSGSNLLARLLKVVLRRWKVLLVCAVACGAVAFVVGDLFSQLNWRTRGTLLYTPLPLSEEQKAVYTPQDKATLIALINSEHHLEALRSEFNLSLPVEILDKQIKVDQVRDTGYILVKVDWPDGEAGANMVNFLMLYHKKYVANLLKKTITTQITQHEEELDLCKKELMQAQAGLDKSRTKIDGQFVDKSSLDSLNKELSTQETTRSNLKVKADNLKAQILRWDEFIEEYKKKEKLGNKNPDDDEDGDKPYAQRKKELITSLRKEENQASEFNQAYKAKYAEFLQLKPLFDQKVIAAKEFFPVRDAKDELYNKLKNSQRLIEQYKKDIKFIARDYALSKKSEFAEQLETANRELRDVETSLRLGKDRAREMSEIIRREEPLMNKFKEKDESRKLIEKQLSALRGVLNKGDEFTLQTEAAPDDHANSSNRKKLSAVAFGVPFLLFLGLVVLRDMSTASWKTESVASGLGLPVLSRSVRAVTQNGQAQAGPPNRSINQSEARGLALRLRQYVPETGAAILLSPVVEGYEVDDLVCAMSRYLAMRDEKVVILDARLAGSFEQGVLKLVERPVVPEEYTESISGSSEDVDPCSTGLVQYLVFEGQNFADFVWPTQIPAVHYMPSGGPYNMTDVLASQPMRDLLDKLGKKYTVILVVGPAVEHNVDTEILASFVQGIVVVINGPTLPAGAEDLFRSLKEANAPLLGSVIM